jgi:hypothetical protein
MKDKEAYLKEVCCGGSRLVGVVGVVVVACVADQAHAAVR